MPMPTRGMLSSSDEEAGVDAELANPKTPDGKSTKRQRSPEPGGKTDGPKPKVRVDASKGNDASKPTTSATQAKDVRIDEPPTSSEKVTSVPKARHHTDKKDVVGQS